MSKLKDMSDDSIFISVLFEDQNVRSYRDIENVNNKVEM